MAEDARLGTEVAGYRIVGVAGRGGMGVVYVAEDARLGRRVALKLLPPDLAEDDRFRDRFVRESRLAASIEHPHIVPIYAAGDAEDTLFIAMRLIPGTDLRTLLAEHGTLDPHRATTLITQIAGALDAAHDHGLVHRDVKPANILVETRAGTDHAYLSDFGLTKQASSVTGLTGTGQLVGTIDYLAPEQIDGKPADGRTDQYALACVLYQCLTGTPPYSRDTEAATLWAHMQEPPPTITDHRPDLPPAINPVLRRALAKPPDNRYPTCGDLATTATTALAPTADAPPPAQRPRRRVAAVVGAVALAALAAGAVLWSRGGTTAGAGPPAVHVRLAAIDLTSGRLGRTVDLPGTAANGNASVATDGDAAWVSDSYGIVRTDLHTGAVRAAKIRHGGGGALVVTPRAAWVAATLDDGSLGVYAFDRSTLHALGLPTRIPIPNLTDRGAAVTGGLAAAGGAVWMPVPGGLRRIDETAPSATSLVRLPLGGLAIAADTTSLWVATPAAGTLARVDAISGRPELGKIRYSGTNQVSTLIAYAWGAIWASDHRPGGTVFECNPATGRCPARCHVPGTIKWLAGGPTTLLAGYYPTAGGFEVAAIDASGGLHDLHRFADPIPAAAVSGTTAYLLRWDGA